jgi:hypothetical protein
MEPGEKNVESTSSVRAFLFKASNSGLRISDFRTGVVAALGGALLDWEESLALSS